MTKQSKTNRHDIVVFSVFLTGLLLLFFWPMIFQGQGYYYGDYKQQFYPWAFYLAERLKHFSLPLWAPEIGCGFPLLAEGQSAALYPLHWLLFFFLPFPFSYHLSFLVLFALAGSGVYFFARACGMGAAGASLACLVFLFGSGYAGLFYGVMALRVLAWFPLSLYGIEKLFQERKPRWAAAVAMAWAMGFLGGYPQMACYAMGTGMVYGLFRWSAIPRVERGWVAKYFLAAVILGLGIAAAQILPTLELVRQSSRAQAQLDFALQKSLNPLNAATLVWPGFGLFLGFDFYVGLLPFCLAVFSVGTREKRALFFAAAAVFFIFLALGRFNPVYVWMLDLLELYFFRVPSKFTFFAGFFLALLAGIGLDRLLSGAAGEKERFWKTLKTIFAPALFVFLSAYFLSRGLKDRILAWAEAYVKEEVYGKPGHIHSLGDYLSRLPAYFDEVLKRTEFTDPVFLAMLVLWAAIFILVALWRKNKQKIALAAVFGITILDLYGYTWLGTGFRGNRVPAETVAADTQASFLRSQKGLFRTYEAVLYPADPPKWMANANLLFGYSTVGVYSPLAIDAYRERLKPIGAVDNASGVYPVSPRALEENKPFLDFLNVRYVILKSGGKDIIEENPTAMPRAFFVRPKEVDETAKTAQAWEGKPLTDGEIEWIQYEPEKLSLNVSAPTGRFLFLSELYYPGWMAFVDERRVDIYRSDETFRALKISPGRHRIEFRYRPLSFYVGTAVSLISLLACLALAMKKSKPGIA